MKHHTARARVGAQAALTMDTSNDDLLALLIERAATHQLQAVKWLHLARDPAHGAVLEPLGKFTARDAAIASALKA